MSKQRSNSAEFKSPASAHFLYRAAPVSLITSLLLIACGGGPDVGDVMEEVVVCSISNCKNSSEIAIDNISPRYTITQTGGLVRADAWLGQSANLLTTARLTGGDRLSASSSGGSPSDLNATDRLALRYVANLNDAAAQPTVTVSFHRDGITYPSAVTMPKAFKIVAPLGPVSLARSAGKLNVQLDVAGTTTIEVLADIACSRSDGSRFEKQDVGIGARLDTDVAPEGVYRIDTLPLDTNLNAVASAPDASGKVNGSPVASCDMNVSWVLSANGSIAPAMNRHGSIVAKRAVSHTVAYDARR